MLRNVLRLIRRVDFHEMKGDLFLSTDMVEPDRRTNYWRAITRPFFDVQPRDGASDARLEGSISLRFFGALSLGQACFNAQLYRRDRRIIRQSGIDGSYLIQLRLSGTAEADFEGRAVSIAPGDVTIIDLGRGWESVATAGSTLSMTLPRDAIDKAASGRSLHATVLGAASPAARAVTDFIVGLRHSQTDPDGADAHAIEEAAIALLVSAQGRGDGGEIPVSPALSRILRQRVLAFVDANLVRSDLGPTLLMRRFRVSRAHLYRMFAAEGGVATMIRDMRLDAAWRRLTHPGCAASSITEIAHDLGFSGSSHFLRAFHAKFGLTPSDARRQGAPLRPPDRQASRIRKHFAGYVSRIDDASAAPPEGERGRRSWSEC